MRNDKSQSQVDVHVLESPVRRQIVDLLANLPHAPEPGDVTGLTAAELASTLQLHVTTARFHLDQLEASELVTSFFRKAGVGRPRKVYRFRAVGMPSHQSNEARQAMAELLAATHVGDDGSEPLTPEEAGAGWARRNTTTSGEADRAPATSAGEWLSKVGRTVDLLQRWGGLPELRTEDGCRTAEISLVDCPFLSSVEDRLDILCGVHRGLLQGAFESLGETNTEIGLRPFVGPRSCLARVTTHNEFAPPAPPSVDALAAG